MVWVLLAWLACARSERFDQCADVACRRAWIEGRWDTDPAAVHAALVTVADPVERAWLVIGLVESWPASAQALCEHLRGLAEHERCSTIAQRPHLWVDPPVGLVARGRPGGGPPGNELLPGGDPADPFALVAPVPPACAGGLEPHTCANREARRAARRGRPEDAAAACRGIDEGKWREECHFRAAEFLVQRRAAEGYADAADLCLASGRYRSNCLTHLVIRLAARLPPAASPAEAFAAAQVNASAIARRWAEQDPDYGAVMVSRYWSELVQRAMAEVPQVTGDLLDLVPAEAAVHVRASAARRLLALEPDEQRSLDEWSAHLDEALALRAGMAPPVTEGDPFVEATDLWPTDRPGEETIPATVYLGTSRRAWSADAPADLAICLLEAAARASPPLEALLAEGEQDTRPLVAWTARRLRERRVQEASALPALEAFIEADQKVEAKEPGRPVRPGSRGSGR